jgi:uncharacterized ferritin-like protein (DUF455 family)
MTSLRTAAHAAWRETDVGNKLATALILHGYWSSGAIAEYAFDPAPTEDDPGRPPQPELVHPSKVAQRSMQTEEGRAALVHAIAHIEFNAINIALDAVWRFGGMPRAYYTDWLKVAAEEAQHFALLAEHLNKLGHRYGDFPAHDGLWDVARRTTHDVLARMALVPRLLEARGLDASPSIREKLAGAGDTEGAAIIDVILADEIGHVAIGNRWYHWLCGKRNLDPLETFLTLLREHKAPPFRGEWNEAARLAAGFTSDEIEALRLFADSQKAQ